MIGDNIIKVGFCTAYDWDLLKNSVPIVYDAADVICISIDKNRKSWSGAQFNFDDAAFHDWLQKVDVNNKIKLYEDEFYLPELTSIENDNRQRNLMAQYMGRDGWHIQIDSDEYFLDFGKFVEYLKKLNPTPKHSDTPLNVLCNWIPLIKKLDDGYLYVDFAGKENETVPFATNCPNYKHARISDHFNVLSNSFVVHETWARGQAELLQKLDSWGHNNDFINKQSYFNLWMVLDKYNYKYIKNIHPLYPASWPSLNYCPGSTIEEFIINLSSISSFDIPLYKRVIKNSKNLSRLKSFISR